MVPLRSDACTIARLYRDQRYQILPAYAQDGIVLARVFQGSTDSAILEDFIEQLLHHCGRWPEPKSAIVMDNASFHHSAKIANKSKGSAMLRLPPRNPGGRFIQKGVDVSSFEASHSVSFYP